MGVEPYLTMYILILLNHLRSLLLFNKFTAVALFFALALLPPIAKADRFVPAVERPESLKAKQYAVRLNREKEDIRCSGTIVSPNGYILTALHCVLSCNIAGVTFRHFQLPSGKQFEGEVYVPSNGSCVFKDIGEAEVVAWGTQFIMDNNVLKDMAMNNWADAKFLIEKGYTAPAGSGDFAIIKLKDKEDLSCARVARRMPKTGERIWSYSFPTINRPEVKVNGLSEYDRPEQKSRDGEAFFSEGVVTSGVLESSRLKNLSADHPLLKFYQDFYNDPKTFWSTSDAEGGMSGAALFNETDEVLGVFVSSLKRPQEYATGTTKSISVLSIIETLENRLGKEKVSQIFNCP